MQKEKPIKEPRNGQSGRRKTRAMVHARWLEKRMFQDEGSCQLWWNCQQVKTKNQNVHLGLRNIDIIGDFGKCSLCEVV